jgi:hypothetical protein
LKKPAVRLTGSLAKFESPLKSQNEDKPQSRTERHGEEGEKIISPKDFFFKKF